MGYRVLLYGLTVLLATACPAVSAWSAKLHEHPRDIFFSDHFLYSAQEEIWVMNSDELNALAKLFKTCAIRLTDSEKLRYRCELARVQHLVEFGTGRKIDKLLCAVQFMTALVLYNRTIGRQSELGLDSRLRRIRTGLEEALDLAARQVSAGLEKER